MLCDYSIIQNYELPNDIYDFLIELKNGCDEFKIFNDVKNDLLNDLIMLGLIDDIPNSNDGFQKNKLI